MSLKMMYWHRFNCRLSKKKIYEELLKLVKNHVKKENKKILKSKFLEKRK